MKRYFLTFVSTLLTAILFPMVASAGEYSISPAKSAYNVSNSESRFGYYLSADPANILESEVTLKNLGNQSVDVKLIPVDAFHDDKGSFILASPNAKQVGIGSWIQLTEQNFILPPRKSIDVPFKINVPGQLAPGTYFGGLMIGETTPGEAMTESGVSVKSFVGVKIFLDISGEEVIKFKWEEFGHDAEEESSIFRYKFGNEGNIMLKANIILTVNDLFGNEVFNHKTAADAFPGKVTEYSVKWDKRPSIGFFKAKSTLSYAKTDIFGKIGNDAASTELSKSTTFYILPILYLSVILAMVLLLIIYISWRVVSMRILKRQLTPYKVKKGDTLFELAQKGGIDWKKLARVNKIKAPYFISSGQMILIKK